MTDAGSADNRRDMLGRALQAIESLEARLAAVDRERSEPIAIVGLACRFPGADSAEAYWRLLAEGRDAVTEVPSDRWKKDEFFDPDPAAPGKMHAPFGGFLERLDLFDAAFFGIAGREADTMDPQQRLLLEVTWAALENATIAADSLRGSQTGVFVGITTTDYARLAVTGNAASFDVYTATGGALNVAAGRLAYVLGLNGPAVAVDTACSSSLVALHLACQSLRTRDCSAAIVGGVNALLTPEPFVCFAKWGMMAPDGRCKTFDEGADGFVRSEGCGVVVLKRLSDAVAAGDRVLALVRGTAVNQDGASSGLTVPNGLAQQAVVRSALRFAGVAPADVDYVEAHGTGTTLGDPIELEALAEVLGEQRRPDRPLLVGSVKTNIGHAESASGIAGLIKVVLAMQHGEIPPNLHFTKLNPRISLHGVSVRVPTVRTPWPDEGRPSVAGVSSFGFSGTNAHAVIEAPRALSAPAPAMVSRSAELLVLSAKNRAALGALATAYAARLRTTGAGTFADICHTAAVGRAALPERLAIVAADAVAAADALDVFVRDDRAPGAVAGLAQAAPKVAFLFTGQGSQYFGMGRELYRTEPVFRKTFDRCAAVVDAELGCSLQRVVGYDSGVSPVSQETRLLDDTRYAQPALFAVELGLADLWRSWGIEPAAVAGHSLGEYVAAVVAGVLTLEEGLALVVSRARLMSALPRNGSMVALFTNEARARAAVAGHASTVAIAAVNGPQNVVISGLAEHVDALAHELQAAGVDNRALAVSHAFHSPLVEPMLDEFEAIASGIQPQPAAIRLVSNLTGDGVADTTALNARYWRRHARETVRFGDVVRTLYAEGVRAFVEIGPAPVLLGVAQQTVAAPDALWLSSMRKDQDPRPLLLWSLGALFVNGARPDWRMLANAHAQRVDLPSYPFQRKHFWLPAAVPTGGSSTPARAAPRDGHALLGRRIASPQRDVLFESPFAVADCPALLEHRVAGVPIVPAAAFIEAALAAARAVLGVPDGGVEGGWLRTPLVLDVAGAPETQLIVSPTEGGGATFEVFSRRADDPSAPWTSHAGGQLVRNLDAAVPVDMGAARQRCSRPVNIEEYRGQMAAVGLDYGPSFRALIAAYGGDREAFGELRLPTDDMVAGRVAVHPGMLDAAFHLIGVAFQGEAEQQFFLPTGYEAAAFSGKLGKHAFAHVRLRIVEPARIVADVSLWRADGAPAGFVRGLLARPASKEQFLSAVVGDRAGLLRIAWRPAASAADTRAGGVWRVVGGSVELCREVAQQLRERGALAEIVDDAATPILGGSRGATGPIAGIIDLRTLELPTLGAIAPTRAMREGPLEQAVALLREIAASAVQDQLRVLFVTREAQAAVAETAVNPFGAALWSIAATAAAELRGLDVRVLDLDATSAAVDTAAAVVSAALRSGGENRLAYRHGQWLAPRLVGDSRSANDDSLAVPAGPYVLGIRERGSLSGLSLESRARTPPGPGQVEIEVLASGLNFRDVLNLLDMYPGPAGQLGNECCGRVVATGAGVTDLAVGTLVACIAEATFASHVIADAALTFPVPARLSLAQAAAFPIAQLTAYWALYRIGGIKRGDRVLIHAGAGGVGLAAVHLALAAGAEVVATAGSEHKREYLREIGVQHVFDSRQLLTADVVKAATGGHGVDLVLNSLTGRFIDEGLAALSQGGRFLEIGLRELRSPEQLAMSRSDVTYHPLLLGDLCRSDSATVRSMYDALVELLDAGSIPPPLVRAQPIAEAGAAFRFMAKARHIGRIAVTHRAIGRAGVRSDAWYLVTGGLGAIGLHVASWLADRGARQVVLLSRSEPSAAAARDIAALRARGVGVDVVRGDVADFESLRFIATRTSTLHGIFHAAGVVDDAVLARLDAERLRRALRPKADGVYNLRRAAAGADLDLFVLFSSGSAIFGAPGQAAYAGANAFLDAIAHGLHSQGCVATSINWGAWADGGMAARLDERTARDWKARGIGTLTVDEALRALEAAVGSGAAQSAVLAINWPTFLAVLDETPPLLAELASRETKATDVKRTPTDLRATLQKLPPKEQLAQLTQRMLAESAAVLGVDIEDIDVRAGLTEQGMDSLMAVELANRLGRLFGVSLPSTFAFDHPTLAALAQHLLAQVVPQAVQTPAPIAMPGNATGAESADLAKMSATELEDELRRELDQAGF